MTLAFWVGSSGIRESLQTIRQRGEKLATYRERLQHGCQWTQVWAETGEEVTSTVTGSLWAILSSFPLNANFSVFCPCSVFLSLYTFFLECLPIFMSSITLLILKYIFSTQICLLSSRYMHPVGCVTLFLYVPRTSQPTESRIHRVHGLLPFYPESPNSLLLHDSLLENGTIRYPVATVGKPREKLCMKPHSPLASY